MKNMQIWRWVNMVLMYRIILFLLILYNTSQRVRCTVENSTVNPQRIKINSETTSVKRFIMVSSYLN